MTTKSGQPAVLPAHVPNGKLNVRFFRGFGQGSNAYVRVAQRGRHWVWERRNHNGSLSSSGVGHPSAEAACSAAGCDFDAEFFPNDGDAMRLAESDIVAGADVAPEGPIRGRDVAKRLRDLDSNEVATPLRLLRALLEAHTDDTLSRGGVPEHVVRRARLLVDRREMIAALESLPIAAGLDRVAKRCTGFVLVADRWWPANIEYPSRGAARMVNYNTIDESGAVSGTGFARWPEWAHCTADGKPAVE